MKIYMVSLLHRATINNNNIFLIKTTKNKFSTAYSNREYVWPSCNISGLKQTYFNVSQMLGNISIRYHVLVW